MNTAHIIAVAIEKAKDLSEFNGFLDRIAKLGLVLNQAEGKPTVAPAEKRTRRYSRFTKGMPANHGKPWFRKDRMVLTTLFNEGRSDKVIAEQLGRTEIAVVAKRTELNLIRGVTTEAPKQGDLQLNGGGAVRA